MKEEYKGYYDFLKGEMDRFKGSFDEYVLYVPDFFRLLCRLLDEDLGREDRRKINSALAYFVIPTDVIPEEIYGPMGYIDDIYLCSRVLKELGDKYGMELLQSKWEAEEDLDEVLEVSFRKSTEMLQERGVVEEVLEFSGLN